MLAACTITPAAVRGSARDFQTTRVEYSSSLPTIRWLVRPAKAAKTYSKDPI